jgi:hypothetical protein
MRVPDLFPALTGWANLCRAYGAGGVVSAKPVQQSRAQVEIGGCGSQTLTYEEVSYII